MPRIDFTDDQFIELRQSLDYLASSQAQLTEAEADEDWDYASAFEDSVTEAAKDVANIVRLSLAATWSPGTDGSITEASGPPAGRHG